MSAYNIYGRYGKRTCVVSDIDESRYRLQIDEDFCRFGGFNDKDTASGASGYSFVDPSGGPFVSVGSPLNSLHAELPAKRITKIESTDEGIILHV
jgi:hypothetical protein